MTGIVPETKNWTWVLERPCEECGFDASTCDPLTVTRLVRENAATWRDLLDTGVIAAGRPDDHTWSTLEYACHVRDIYRRNLIRIELLLGEDDPAFMNWDQDRSAVDESYESQDPATVVADLGEAAAAVASRLNQVTEHQWERTGRRSDGSSFSLESLARYMIHDPIHHIWDVDPERT